MKFTLLHNVLREKFSGKQADIPLKNCSPSGEQINETLPVWLYLDRNCYCAGDYRLLLGGVLKGQEKLINSAKVKNLAGDFKNIPVFIYGYQDKYKGAAGR